MNNKNLATYFVAFLSIIACAEFCDLHAAPALPDTSVKSSVITHDSSGTIKSVLSVATDTSGKSQEMDSTLFYDTVYTTSDSEDSLVSEEWPDSLNIPDSSSDTVKSAAEASAKVHLYPGISMEQDSLARALLRRVWSFAWDDVDKIAHKMRRIENREHRPALSVLLCVATNVVRFQFGEIKDKHVAKNCLEEIEEMAKIGIELSDPEKSPDSLMATNLLIYGGIKGLLATMQLDKNLVGAAVDGLNALNNIEKSMALEPELKDAALGQGIFYCALAKASPFVRGALNLMGHQVSLEKGINCLRESAASARYTSVLAKIYLIEFLSPYMDDQANEKRIIFKSLKSSYPNNPYFLFLELEENLCFHPEHAFDPSIRRMVKKKIGSFSTGDYTRNLYASLVRWQYLLVDPFATSRLRPDTTFDLREYAYYPVFLSGLREKYVIQQKSSNSSSAVRQRQIKVIRRTEIRAKKILEESAMSSSWKGFYLWHIRDALRIR